MKDAGVKPTAEVGLPLPLARLLLGYTIEEFKEKKKHDILFT